MTSHDLIILKELDIFDAFSKSRTHFIIFPKACNLRITTLTSPLVTDTQILIYTNYTYWYCNEYLKRGNCPVQISSFDVIAHFS